MTKMTGGRCFTAGPKWTALYEPFLSSNSDSNASRLVRMARLLVFAMVEPLLVEQTNLPQ